MIIKKTSITWETEDYMIDYDAESMALYVMDKMLEKFSSVFFNNKEEVAEFCLFVEEIKNGL